jgi:hypothetical protein
MRCEDCGCVIEDRYDLCWSCYRERYSRSWGEVRVAYKKVVHETDKAWRVVVDDSDPWQPKAYWIAKSVAELDEANNVVSVPRWFAEQEDLEALDE